MASWILNKMRGKLFLLLICIFLIGVVSSIETSYCCERLKNNGPWCQNAPQDQCDASYGKAPTSCESTSYCKLGVCVNSQEGDCMPNTPQRVCEDNGGLWNEKKKSELPQCQLGCCLIGDEAAFVTQTRCKKLSSIYGLEVNYRTDIQNERECISSAMPQTKGACVFEQEYERNCKMLTKKECQEMQGNGTEFHEGYLCSAESLSTICGPRGGTTCVEGEDKVYFMDTCGNLANVYDASKLNNQNYWEKVTAADCGAGVSNAGSSSCGNCDYYLGSTCKKGVSAQYGDFMCKDLKCEYEGQVYQHGETWCAADKENEKTNSPGGRNFRLVCYNNEVLVEACEEYRQQVCIEDSIGDFKAAACRANQWQDCYSQEDKKECENSDVRDCKWVEGYSILKNGTAGYSTPDKQEKKDSCVPRYAPGFDFWGNATADSETVATDGESICSLANDVCMIEYYAGTFEGALSSALGSLGGGGESSGNDSIQWKPAGDPRCMADCKEKHGGLLDSIGGKYTMEANCAKECIKYSCIDESGEVREEWMTEREDVCVALGDCGVKNNYIGKQGYFDNWEDTFVREKVEKNASSKGGGSSGGLLGGIGSMFGMG